MEIDVSEVEVGFIVNLETLRKVLQGLSVGGRRWWIACDPLDALDRQALTVGHGDPGCKDRLNTLYYNFPVLNCDKPLAGPDRLVVCVDSSVISAEQPGLYMEDGQVLEDVFADMECFFQPIRQALIEWLKEN
jgi:hypothetical protein